MQRAKIVVILTIAATILLSVGLALTLKSTTIAETTTTTTIEQTTTTTIQEEFGKEESQDLGKQEEDQLGAQEDQDDLQKSDTIETVLDENVAKAALEAKNLNELKEMAKPFPSAEWRTLNKSELIDYILEKIK